MSHVKKLVESLVYRGINGYYCNNCSSSSDLEDLVWDIDDKPKCQYCGAEGHVDLHTYSTHDGTKPVVVGDSVYWHDPDDDTCSRIVKVEMIYGQADYLTIVGTDGSELHCPHSELEPLIECPECHQTFSCNDELEGICISYHGYCRDCKVKTLYGQAKHVSITMGEVSDD